MFKVIAITTIILKRILEAQNDLKGGNSLVHVNRIGILVENDMWMELSRCEFNVMLSTPTYPTNWSPFLKDYLKLNVVTSWKQGQVAMLVLAK